MKDLGEVSFGAWFVFLSTTFRVCPFGIFPFSASLWREGAVKGMEKQGFLLWGKRGDSPHHPPWPNLLNHKSVPHQSPPTKFLFPPHKCFCSPIVIWNGTSKSKRKIIKISNKKYVSFRGILIVFCLVHAFLRELTIHDHESLL